MNYFELLQWMYENPAQSVVALFAQYALCMVLYHRTENKFVRGALAVWFIPQDVVVNVSAMSIIGLESPQEFLVTQRLQRWVRNTKPGLLNDWRFTFANKTCQLLHMFDAGHCD